jgi:hypothetical protein
MLVEAIGALVPVVEGAPLGVLPQADKASNRLKVAAIDADRIPRQPDCIGEGLPSTDGPR